MTTRPQALAPASVVVQAFRTEHDFWKAQWRQHRCDQCVVRLSCRTAVYFLKQANAASQRVVLAESREARR